MAVGVVVAVVVAVGVDVDVATCVLEVGAVPAVVVVVGVNVDVATCVLEVGVATAVVVVVGVNVVAQRRCRSWRNRASRRSSESWAHNLSVGGCVTHRRIRGDAAVSLRRGVGR